MFRTFLIAALVFAVVSFAVTAEEYKGVEVVKIEDKTITVKVGDKEMTFVINEDTKVIEYKGKDRPSGGAGGAKGFRPPAPRAPQPWRWFDITTRNEGDKEIVTVAKAVSAPKDKDKKKDK